MELRQQYTTSQSFETGHNHPQSGITAEWSYVLMGAGALNEFTGRTVAPENGYSVYPRENMRMHGRYYASERDMEIRPFEHASSFIFDGSTAHENLSNPYYNSFPYFPPCGRFYPTPENNTALSRFGYPNWHTVHEVQRGLHNHAMDTGRGRLKRKRLGNSLAYERGSTNRHYNAGRSSNSLEFWRDEPTFGYQNYPSSSIGLPHYRGSSLSIDNEDPSRNVRRRQNRLDWEFNPSTDVRRHCRLDWEVNRRRTYSTNNLSHYYGSTAQNRSRPVEVVWLNADETTHDQNRVATFSAAHRWFQISGSSGFRPEINQYSARGSAADFNGHIHDSISNRNSIFPPSHIHGRHGLAGLEGCYRYSQRTIPSYRTGLSTAHSERAAPAENSLQFHSESYSSRYSLSVGGWHGTHQDPRSRTAVERFESLSNAVNVHDQMDHMTVNRSHFYVSRDLFDQYRDMRLDIDNMSYEELLSLGERIGNVRTGLSNNVISKCLVKTTYSTLDDNKKEGPCVICQEDYSDIDEVASIKNCCHDYHTGCIMKWLLIKNACPICQGPALANSPKKN